MAMSHNVARGCEYTLPSSCPVAVVNKFVTRGHTTGHTCEDDFDGELEGLCQGRQGLGTTEIVPKYLRELLDRRFRLRSILDAF